MRPRIHGNVLKAALILTVGVLVIFFLSSCSDSSQTATNRCIKVSRAKLDGIASGLTVSGGGSLRDGWAVKSEDFNSLYFIAAEIDGSGLEGNGDIGLWASNSLESGQGLILSVNSIAKEFSVWPHGDTTDSNITQFDDGADEAKKCIEASQGS
jgi:hypothetical protein